LLVQRWPGCYVPAIPPKRMLVGKMRELFIYIMILDENNGGFPRTKKETI